MQHLSISSFDGLVFITRFALILACMDASMVSYVLTCLILDVLCLVLLPLSRLP